MKIPLSKICTFINNMCFKYNIDESHGLKHAMDVYKFSRNIVLYESSKYPELLLQQPIIYTAALLHDTCDKKYMDENEGIENIKQFLYSTKEYEPSDTDIILKIIKTMSYSKVKKNGYPKLGEYQNAYHIVRESDLLAAYDFDRGLLYTMNSNNLNYKNAFPIAKDLYEVRMAKHIDDGLIVTNYGKIKAKELLEENIKNIKQIENVLYYDTD